MVDDIVAAETLCGDIAVSVVTDRILLIAPFVSNNGGKQHSAAMVLAAAVCSHCDGNCGVVVVAR